MDEENVSLSLVFQVPKGRKKKVNARGRLRAYYDFQTASADLKKDWLKYIRSWFQLFGPHLKDFFNGGAHITSEKPWQDILKSAY